MKAIRLGMVLLVVMLMSSCALKQTWDLNGKWQKVDGQEVLEFSGKGIMKCTVGEKTDLVSFRLSDTNKIQYYSGSIVLGTVEFVVVQKTLTITDAKGQVVVYNKIR